MQKTFKLKRQLYVRQKTFANSSSLLKILSLSHDLVIAALLYDRIHTALQTIQACSFAVLWADNNRNDYTMRNGALHFSHGKFHSYDGEIVTWQKSQTVPHHGKPYVLNSTTCNSWRAVWLAVQLGKFVASRKASCTVYDVQTIGVFDYSSTIERYDLKYDQAVWK